MMFKLLREHKEAIQFRENLLTSFHVKILPSLQGNKNKQEIRQDLFLQSVQTECFMLRYETFSAFCETFVVVIRKP